VLLTVPLGLQAVLAYRELIYRELRQTYVITEHNTIYYTHYNHRDASLTDEQTVVVLFGAFDLASLLIQQVWNFNF